jgi:microcystin degradation protein MlrC
MATPGKKKIRIAYLRIAQESNAFSPIFSTFEDFERTHYLEGTALAEATSARGWEMKDFLKNAELSGFVKAMTQMAEEDVELIPLFSAWAVPGGSLSRETVTLFLEKIETFISQAGQLDGVFFSMHGAMCGEDMAHPEVNFLEKLRGLVGPKVKIAVTMDLHAQVTDEMIQLVDILAGYRTNPHRDHARVGFRAGEILLDAIRGEVMPTMEWRSLPMLYGGGTTIDFLPPMRRIYKLMKEMEKDRRVLYVTLMNGNLWHSSPTPGWSVIVVTDDNGPLAARLAEELADQVWELRKKPPPAFKSGEEAIGIARKAKWARSLGTVCMCDASDVVGAGGTGENTNLLREFMDSGQDLITYLPIRDSKVVTDLWESPEGSAVNISVGGKLDSELNPPVEFSGTLYSKADNHALGRAVTVTNGKMYLVITEEAPIAMAPKFFTQMGLKILKADVVVVKSFFPFHLYFGAYKRKSVYVKTKGITDFEAYTGENLADELYPLHDVRSWRRIDSGRRPHPKPKMHVQ